MKIRNDDWSRLQEIVVKHFCCPTFLGLVTKIRTTTTTNKKKILTFLRQSQREIIWCRDKWQPNHQLVNFYRAILIFSFNKIRCFFFFFTYWIRWNHAVSYYLFTESQMDSFYFVFNFFARTCSFCGFYFFSLSLTQNEKWRRWTNDKSFNLCIFHKAKKL